MTTRFERSFTVAAPVEAVLEAIRDPATIELTEKNRNALRVAVRDVERSSAVHRYDIEMEEYVFGLTGVDRSKTERTRIEFRWDLERRASRWVWRSASHDRYLKLSGEVLLAPDGASRTRITMILEPVCRTPIVGRLVESGLGKSMMERWPDYVSTIERRAAAVRARAGVDTPGAHPHSSRR